MNETHQYCTFYLDDRYFGIDVLKVQEIVRPQSITRVPLTSPIVRGLINLRGQIVTAIDVRRRLNLTPLDSHGERPGGDQATSRATPHAPLNVVVRTDDGAVSLLVDEIGDVLTLPSQSLAPPPQTLPTDFRDVILGAYQLPDQLLVILDVDCLTQIPSDVRT